MNSFYHVHNLIPVGESGDTMKFFVLEEFYYLRKMLERRFGKRIGFEIKDESEFQNKDLKWKNENIFGQDFKKAENDNKVSGNGFDYSNIAKFR